jgi:hypothetical protein
MESMKKIEMPADFYAQTPEANVLATEAVMNTIKTADSPLIDRPPLPLNARAAGGLSSASSAITGRCPLRSSASA